MNLSEATNLYQPNNQNDGVQQYNDRALLRMDYAASNPLKKARTIKTIGWIGGSVMVVAGVYLLTRTFDVPEAGLYIGSISALSIGIIGGVTCLKIAHKIKKETETLQASSLYQYAIPITNGSSFSVSADILSDRLQNNNTLGLGLRYNF